MISHSTNYINKRLMITGGTGSFGNAVLKHFLNFNLDEIVIFSRDEKKQDEMRTEYQNDKIKFVIGDVRNYQSVNKAMKDIDFVFHAAALKQVPSCEFFPMEAVQTNILGAENVLESAFNNKVKKLVVLSTDKAVYPINAMGISKAMMEKLMIAKARSMDSNYQTFCATRYGNVMGSRGSVIPLFIKQIKDGKPITVTDPKMTRFMMSLYDSVDLVMFAFENAFPGDIFVQKAPSATIGDLATALLELYNTNSKISIIGTRHGEKVYETLCNKEEMAKAVDFGEFYRIPVDGRDLNYAKYLSDGSLKTTEAQDYTSHNTKLLTIQEIKDLLLTLDFIKNDLK